MNSKLKILLGAILVILVGAGAAGGAVWWMSAQQPTAAKGESAQVTEKKEKPAKPAKYMTLEKVIVMLRRSPNDMSTHYLSTDLVLATDELGEKQTKEHLPLLRAIAVRALSAYTLAEASSMSVEQYAEQLNETFTASYAKQEREKPFGEVMIGKLIVE